jgi:hypothetical protein
MCSVESIAMGGDRQIIANLSIAKKCKPPVSASLERRAMAQTGHVMLE